VISALTLAALGWAGLKMVRPDSAQWAHETMPDATPQQLRVRAGWLTGHTDR
jgi:hypothetical protein